MSDKRLVLIDFSSILHPIWHMSGNEPDPNWTSTQVVAKVRALASGQPHVVIACDSRKSFRRELEPTYKAQREAKPAPFYHQLRTALDTLKGDGFPILEADGFEADDAIASMVAFFGSPAAIRPEYKNTRAILDHLGTIQNIIVVSSDKDLLQLVCPSVTVKSATTGNVLDEAGVVEKFGVKPNQMRDYLSLVGDASDNVRGAKGIGAKTAAALLAKFGTLDALMTPESLAQLTPSQRESLTEFAGRADTVRQLITLRTDVPLNFEEVWRERVPTDTNLETGEIMDDISEAMPTVMLTNEMLPPPPPAPPFPFPPLSQTPSSAGSVAAEKPSLPNGGASAALESTALAPAPVEWEKQLEPRTMGQAIQLATLMFQAKLFNAYGTPQAVLSTILAGRELGMPAMQSLRGFHIIESRPTLSAGIIQSLVLKSSDCEYFRCTERTNERATFEAKRRDNPSVTLTFTVDDAKRAWSKTPAAFDQSGWGRNPADMCVARAATKLARLVFPDVVNMYAPEESE